MLKLIMRCALHHNGIITDDLRFVKGYEKKFFPIVRSLRVHGIRFAKTAESPIIRHKDRS